MRSSGYRLQDKKHRANVQDLHASHTMEHEEMPVPLPCAPHFNARPNIVIQPPLSRRGVGPGLVILVEEHMPLAKHEKTLDPPPLLKWAEEGYAVAQIMVSDSSFEDDLRDALLALRSLNTCVPNAKFGLISYCSSLNEVVLQAINFTEAIIAVVSYGVELKSTSKWYLAHVAGRNASLSGTNVTVHTYPEAGPLFVLPAHPNYRSASAALSHTRTLAFLKPHLEGPHFDLEAVWEEHTRYEFAERAVEKTMGTMVQEPYVNHVPTITGGIGRERLTHFYRNHFVHSNPPDTNLELVSRTVGIDRVIDEFVFSCTHDRVIDWLIPGVPPTGKKLEVPFTCVINIRGDRLFHEHISWDQATLLRQIALLPDYLPFPYPVNGRDPAPGRRFEYRVPTAGAETARKLVDENSVPSNEMFGFGIREVSA